MKALVVYDSFFGNTEKIAQAMGDALKSQAEVRTLRVGDVKPEHLTGLSLLIVGLANSRNSSAPAAAMKVWLKTLPPTPAWRQSRSVRHARPT